MEEIRVVMDKNGNTLHVWFDDPSKEHICEETGDEVILIKDIDGNVIGFDKLNYKVSETYPPSIVAEVV